MTIAELKEKGLIILECISGSRAYGLATPASDTDIKGVFLLPKEMYYGMDYIAQVSNPTNDIVYYELGRYMELLALNNPNILELLNTPEESIIYKHPYLEELKSDIILSKLCKNTFGKFALSQIKKAKGLNKKIVNPIEKKRKNILSFCYINYDQGAIPLTKYLKINQLQQEDLGIVNITHMKGLYGLYHNSELKYAGIIKNELSNDISLSSIPKGEKQIALLYFNKEGYSKYCKSYKEYWDWVSNRNENRYQNTKSHGKNYDAKNMMHTFRLLEMATEIATEKKILVKRPNRGFLLDIKNGKFDYQELLNLAKELQRNMETAFEQSELRDRPDREQINRLIFEIRNKFYTQQ